MMSPPTCMLRIQLYCSGFYLRSSYETIAFNHLFKMLCLICIYTKSVYFIAKPFVIYISEKCCKITFVLGLKS